MKLIMYNIDIEPNLTELFLNSVINQNDFLDKQTENFKSKMNKEKE